MKSIAEALVKAQINFEIARKTSNNPHFKSKYASLDVCIDAVREALNAEGVFLSQPCHECSDGVIVETVFLHSSGESFSGGKLHVPAAKNDPQGYGSALTYARRYSLLSACGIAPEDDDGNASVEATTRPKQQKAQETPPAPAKAEYRRIEGIIKAATGIDGLSGVPETIDAAEMPQKGKDALTAMHAARYAELVERAFV